MLPRLVCCETHLLKPLSVLLVGVMVYHSNQIDALRSFAMLWLPLTLKMVPWKFRSFGWLRKLNSIHLSLVQKVQQPTNMSAGIKLLSLARSWLHPVLCPLVFFTRKPTPTQHQRLRAPYNAALCSGLGSRVHPFPVGNWVTLQNRLVARWSMLLAGNTMT